MRILARYLLREMTVPFLIGQATIVLLLTGSVLYNNAQVFLQFQVPLTYIVRITLFFIPFLVHMTMPVAMAVGASLAVSRLSRDSEITVLRSAGISVMRIFTPIFVIGFVVSVVDFYFGETVVPASIIRYQEVVGELITHLKSLTPLAGQSFVSSDQNYVVGVGSMIARRGYIELHDVEINASARLIGSTQPFVAIASSGRYQNGVWTLYRPLIISFDPEHPDRPLLSWPQEVRYTIPADPQAFQNGMVLQMPMGQLATSSMLTLHQLGRQIAAERARHITDYRLILDYYFKLSVPFSCLVMALCCPPIAMRFGRSGGFGGTLLSICLVFVYWNTLLLSRILGSPGPQGSPPLLPPLVAAWSQNVLFSAWGLWMIVRSE
ncbi:MAG TPA: LptF/LptG family permease [Chthonomonas sp.]|uniref:LptF/LptG family permease n=1 Tax=Chthonomonas sp. TaxID=2282153 RepID=UPI002B4AF8A0|nr:LptF/LptG family permease [Chthonomonas sp.]HLI47359.1 LptF/LptG family permease [Chthonomonas sp.]